MNMHEPLSTLKALMAFVVLLVAFALFAMYMMNGPLMAEAGQLTSFKALAIIEGGLLLTLLYLVNKTEHSVKSKSKSKRRK